MNGIVQTIVIGTRLERNAINNNNNDRNLFKYRVFVAKENMAYYNKLLNFEMFTVG